MVSSTTEQPADLESVASSNGGSASASVTSSTPKTHICDFPGCTNAYAKKSLLVQHRRSHTGERPFKCSNCDRSFLRKSHLTAHQVSHQSQQEKPFHCSVCGKGVNTSQHLRRHEITHTKSFKCTHKGCDESFYKHQSLRHHLLSVHEKSLTCTICNKTFTRPYRLAQHNIKYHSETPTYQCDYKGCFKNFKTWSALHLHVKTDHPKLVCDVCGKGCIGKQGLQSHMVVHSSNNAIKLWNCEYCDMGLFVKKLELIEHYHEFHDSNLPENLLKPEEKAKIEELLKEGDIIDSLDKLKSIEEFDPEARVLKEAPDGFVPTPSSQASLASLLSLTSALNKNNVVNLLQKNYNKKTIACPKNKCDRKFARDFDLKRHLAWHELHSKRISLFLESLQTEEEKFDNNNENLDNEDDSNMDQMIDDELKRLNSR